jgi:hypothetical protein
MTRSPQRQPDLWAVPLNGERKAKPLLNSKFSEAAAQISPDGKWLAYSSNETGRVEVYVRPFPAGEGKWLISSAGGYLPRWRHDTRELYYVDQLSYGRLMAVEVQGNGQQFSHGPPQKLFDAQLAFASHNIQYFAYAVSTDGQRFLITRPFSKPTSNPASAPIVVVTNWFEEVKQRVSAH